MSPSDTDRTDAIAALERLGLTQTEARLLLGLQRLGSATAREIAETTEIPRSQVYGTAESLEEIGLLHVQNANPTSFHATDPEEIGSILMDRLERDLETAMERLTALEREQTSTAETKEEIWTVRGRESIDRRIAQFLGAATTRVIFGVSDVSLLTDTHVQLLADTATGGRDVLVISSDDRVLDRLTDLADIVALEPPESISEDDHVGRLLIIDDEIILHSVLVPDATGTDPEEVAFWSRESGFAGMVISLMEHSLEEVLPE